MQLTPVFEDGDEPIADGATLEEDETAVPLELDLIYSSLDELTVALGPTGANRNGALSDLLESTAANFGGRASSSTRRSRSSAAPPTLDNNKEELFGSAARVEGFIGTLARNDQTVRRFNAVAGLRSRPCSRASAASCARRCATWPARSGRVSTFVQENREVLGRNIKGLGRVAKVLVKQRDALDEILTAGPLALNNLALTYNRRPAPSTRARTSVSCPTRSPPIPRRFCAASSTRATPAVRPAN